MIDDVDAGGSAGASRAEAAGDDWDRHWATYADSAAANPAQRYRHELILRLLRHNGPPQRLLDIGSGTGDLAAAVRLTFPETDIVGLELSAAGVGLARRKLADARFVQRDLTTAAPPPAELRGWATHAVCSEVLEHVDDPGRLLENVRPYLGSGCRMIVTVPGGPMSAYDRHIGHRRHYSAADLESVLRGAGFAVEWVRGAGFPVFNGYRLLMLALGDRLTHVAAGRPSLPARAVMAMFVFLLQRNLRFSHRGWQIVASARLPAEAVSEPR